MTTAVCSRKLLLRFILFTLFLFKNCHQASLRPFQLQCYKDVCTWPLQYCSSQPHERRCIPCSRSVCGLESPPLQCLYNCSFVEQKGNITVIAHEDDCSNTALFFSFGFCGILFFTVAALAAIIYKLTKTIKIKKEKSEEMQSLTTSLRSEQTPPDNQKTKENKRDNDSYTKRKLTEVPPTRDSSSHGSYKPTTHLDKGHL